MDLIYPFGINETQYEAVKNAFKFQISIIEGPPGTGKTQTILNIIVNIVINKKPEPEDTCVDMWGNAQQKL